MSGPINCTAKCLANYGKNYGKLTHLILAEHERRVGFAHWSGFKILAVNCRHHGGDATHIINDPDAAYRFTMGALVGRQTAADMLTQHER